MLFHWHPVWHTNRPRANEAKLSSHTERRRAILKPACIQYPIPGIVQVVYSIGYVAQEHTEDGAINTEAVITPRNGICSPVHSPTQDAIGSAGRPYPAD